MPRNGGKTFILLSLFFRTERVRRRKKYVLHSKIKRHLRSKVRVWRRVTDTSGGSLCWASSNVMPAAEC
ncbi:hypothetical protein CY34DRAFT_805563 [Suillus luteus UH-Slu-Lm8-n1]|uniref:Uncharacterized protein n=1 Tax=Suillus luteus UH-Slu-Lm8-n1 TaxID=930992 RepID=A0A0D0BEZ4_9AGAM|nr:hypothetical protein CY34DRAFT_805563 [Suillus luteus UH-Slu-Lm8-n1]